MAPSKIEWTDSTWNPLTGCTKISVGCRNCYAERMALRLKSMGNSNYQNGFHLTLHENLLELPLNWKTSQYIFVNSMSDLFHEDVPNKFIFQIFEVMKQAYWHTFQVLTKRSIRLLDLDTQIDWPENVWMGVSVENEDNTFRIDHLRNTHARLKFLSLEPLLGPIANLNLNNINWVIVGGESGPNARPLFEPWVKDIRDECIKNQVPFFFKQWGGINKKKSGRLLEGRTWDAIPSQG
jgi:protein gp37